MRKSIKTAAICLSALLCMTPNLSGCSRINENNYETVLITSADSLSADLEFDDSCYIYSSLTEKEREYYDLIKTAAENFETEVIFPEEVNPEILRKLFIAVYYQEEEIFWLDSLFFRPEIPSKTLSLAYRYKQDEAERMEPEIKAAADKILSGFTEAATDYEKLLAFHDHLVLNCTFSKSADNANTLYGALVDGYAQCEGYAFTFDYLCRLAGIDCFTVYGYNSENEPHAWNMVKLEDMWYYVDCTWDDPILDPVDTEFIRHYYFLVSDADILSITHIPDNSYFALPICASTKNYYKREGLYAESAEDGIELLRQNAVRAVTRGRKDAAVRFADKRSYESAVSRLFDSKEINGILTNVNAVCDKKVVEKKYVRYCNDDELIIHVSMFYQ